MDKFAAKIETLEHQWMRALEEDDRQGLDVTNHGERGWEFD